MKTFDIDGGNDVLRTIPVDIVSNYSTNHTAVYRIGVHNGEYQLSFLEYSKESDEHFEQNLVDGGEEL